MLNLTRAAIVALRRDEVEQTLKFFRYEGRLPIKIINFANEMRYGTKTNNSNIC